MKILVTGASGFIASHLIERLLSEGHHVLGLDKAKPTSVYRLSHKNLDYQIVDLTQYHGLDRLLASIDWVFHLAGKSDIIPSITNPLSYHDANVTATVNLLESARLGRVKRFVYAASSTCYGKNPPLPTPETAAIDPQYPYALTKYLGEQYALHWARVYKLPVVSLRLFNVYGPRSRASGDYGPVFSTFMAQKLAKKPHTVVGNGKQTRDFTFVSDVVDAFITAAKSRVSGEVFNVGSGGTYSINSLVKLIGGSAVHIPKRPGEPDSSWADITKIKKVLGWKPKVSFASGVKEILNHIDDWKDAPVWTPTTIKKATKQWFTFLT